MEGNLKANVDAGWDQASKHAGIGIIIRNHHGEPILTEWRFVPVCASAEEAEVQACLMGMKHLIDLQCWAAILESDCLRAIQAINADGHEMLANWALLYEACELLRVYQHIEVKKVDRLSNGVAHVLSQLGKAGFSSVLHDSTPECVQDLIINDVEVI
jgi:ribonuclease HI